MGKLAGFKYRDTTTRLKQKGFIFLREAKGSHEIWYNSNRNIYTTLPKHRGDIPEGTLREILRQADIEPEDF